MEAPPLSSSNEQGQPHPGNVNFPQQRPQVNSHPVPQLHVGPIYRPILPSGWTEHRAPNGIFYYYNAATGQSTWERPIVVPPPPPPLMGHPVASHPFQQMPGMIPNLQQNVSTTQQAKEQPKEKKKEKAKVK